MSRGHCPAARALDGGADFDTLGSCPHLCTSTALAHSETLFIKISKTHPVGLVAGRLVGFLKKRVLLFLYWILLGEVPVIFNDPPYGGEQQGKALRPGLTI